MPREIQPIAKAELRRLYLDEGLSTRAIASRYGISKPTVVKWMRLYDIPRRDRSCGLWQKTGKPNPCTGRTGEASPMWGRHASAETRQKQREAMLGRHNLERHPRWKGGRTHHYQGYIKVKRPDHPAADANGYIFEHRVVMEEIIGRYLEPREVVHHKNGDKQDNRPENLELMTWGEHTTHHTKGIKRSEEFKQHCREGQLRKGNAGADFTWYKSIEPSKLQTALVTAKSLKGACVALSISKRTFYNKLTEHGLWDWYKSFMRGKQSA